MEPNDPETTSAVAIARWPVLCCGVRIVLAPLAPNMLPRNNLSGSAATLLTACAEYCLVATRQASYQQPAPKWG
jgi:hypothetical protein